MGWHFPPDRWHDLERGIRATAQDLGFANVHACLEWLQTAAFSPQDIAVLTQHFTVGETYFFREPRAFEILTTEILPPLIRARQHGDRQLRIWSAACCTGEEPYSIAMTLAMTMPALSEWQVSIIGTDINPQFLQRATEGVYSAWSFRSTPDWVKARYFRQTDDNRFVIDPAIQRMVTFLPLNLADDVFSAPLNATNTLDVIFCRNVFIYCSQERSQAIIRNFHQTLRDDGWFIVSPSETIYLTHTPFTPVSFPGIIAHQKRLPATRQQKAVPPPFPLPREQRLDQFPQPPSQFVASADSARKLVLPKSSPTLPPPPTPASVPASTTSPSPAPSDGSTRYDEARTLYTQGRYREVCETLGTTVTISQSPAPPLNQDEMFLLIRAYVNQGAANDAIEWCNKAIATDVFNPRFYYLLATVLLEQGREEEASQALRRTLYLDREFILAHFTSGNLAHRQKNRRAARRHFHNALELLRLYQRDTVLPESEGLTAGRLSDLIRTMLPD